MSAVPGGWDQSQIPESSRASTTSSVQPETIRPTESTLPLASSIHEEITQDLPTTSQNPFLSTNNNDSATSIDAAIKQYIDWSPSDGPWPHQYHFASVPLHQLESKGADIKKQSAIRGIMQAHSKWRKGLKLPKVYPEEIEWKTLPTNLTDLLQYALIMDQVIGVDKQKLTFHFFINYSAHERFMQEINTYATQHTVTQKTDSSSVTHCKVYINLITKAKCPIQSTHKAKMVCFVPIISHGFSFVPWGTTCFQRKKWPLMNQFFESL